MSKRLFVKKFITSFKNTGAILPSSSFLAKKMVLKSDIENSNIIIEMGAGTGVFTHFIFKYALEDINKKQIFIIEKDIDFYNLLIKKFPKYKSYIYNIDILDLDNLLESKGIKKVDLVISGLPFKSLPKEFSNYIFKSLFKKYFTKETKLIQFSYFLNFGKFLKDKFGSIKFSKCLLNIPKAYIFYCNDFNYEYEKK